MRYEKATINPAGAQTSLTITAPIIATLVKCSPALTISCGEIIKEQYSVTQSNGTKTLLTADNGNYLDLYDFQGETVKVTYKATIQTDIGTSEVLSSGNVTVPTFATVLQLKDNAPPNGTTVFNTFANAMAALNSAASNTILEIYPHSGGTWSLVPADYDIQITGTGKAIRGVGASTPIFDGNKATANENDRSIFDIRATTFSLTNIRIDNPFFSGVSIDSADTILLKDITVNDTYGRGVQLSGAVGADNIEFQNVNVSGSLDIPGSFNIGGADPNGYGILISGTNDNIAFHNCSTNNSDIDGIVTTFNTTNILVSKHLSNGNGRQGLLFINGAKFFEIKNSIFSNNGATGIQIEDSSGEGLPITDTQDGVIKYNTCHNNNWNNRVEAGIWLEGCIRVLCEHNTCYNNNNGILVGTNATDIIVRNNNLYQNNPPATIPPAADATVVGSVSFGLYIQGGVVNSSFYNNTLWSNGNVNCSEASSFNHGSGIFCYANNAVLTSPSPDTQASSNINIKNNIVSDSILDSSGSGAGANLARQVATHPTDGNITAVVNQWDHNQYYNPPRDAYYESNIDRTFAQWQSTVSLDLNTTTNNPTITAGGIATTPDTAAVLTTMSSKTGAQITVAGGTGAYFWPGDCIDVAGEVLKISSKTGDTLTLNKEPVATAGADIQLFDSKKGKILVKGVN